MLNAVFFENTICEILLWMGKRDPAIWTSQPEKALNGGLDNVMIFKRALTTQEIQNLM